MLSKVRPRSEPRASLDPLLSLQAVLYCLDKTCEVGKISSAFWLACILHLLAKLPLQTLHQGSPLCSLDWGGAERRTSYEAGSSSDHDLEPADDEPTWFDDSRPPTGDMDADGRALLLQCFSLGMSAMVLHLLVCIRPDVASKMPGALLFHLSGRSAQLSDRCPSGMCVASSELHCPAAVDKLLTPSKHLFPLYC